MAKTDLTIRRGAVIVFEGLDFFLVSILLWTGQWKTLAKRYVRLDGKPLLAGNGFVVGEVVSQPLECTHVGCVVASLVPA